MNSTDLFKKDFKEASTIIRNMSEEEVSALQEAVSHMTPSFQSRYARLLVFRKDSLRLLSLLNDGEPELCHNCVKYLKIRAIRKDLMSKLTDEAAFIELFNKSCDLGKSILLECLVWNKDRPTDCLADRLSKNPNLVLNAAQSALLKNARSIEACVEDNAVGRKKYYRLRTRDIEKSALRKLHALYCGYKKEDRSKTENKCDELLCHVHNLTTTITVGEERLTALDIILNLFCVINDDVTRAKFFLNNLPKSTPATLNALSPHMSDTQRAVRLRFCSLTDAFKAVMCLGAHLHDEAHRVRGGLQAAGELLQRLLLHVAARPHPERDAAGGEGGAGLLPARAGETLPLVLQPQPGDGTANWTPSRRC